ncbi:MAG: FMN-binding protein [Bacteroidales bacterium]
MLVYIFLVAFAINSNKNSAVSTKHLDREVKKISKCENPVYQSLSSSLLDIDTLKGCFFEYKNALPIKYAYLGRVHTCRAGGCTLSNTPKSNDESEFFDYYILFDTLAQIISVHVFNYEATHGQEITVKAWLKQFIGYNASKGLSVGKDIDAISGATISVYSITNDIVEKTSILKHYISHSFNNN